MYLILICNFVDLVSITLKKNSKDLVFEQKKPSLLNTAFCPFFLNEFVNKFDDFDINNNALTVREYYSISKIVFRCDIIGQLLLRDVDQLRC